MTIDSIRLHLLSRPIATFAILAALTGPAVGQINPNPTVLTPSNPPDALVPHLESALVPYIPRQPLNAADRIWLSRNWPNWQFATIEYHSDSPLSVVGQIPEAGAVLTPGQKLHLLVQPPALQPPGGGSAGYALVAPEESTQPSRESSQPWFGLLLFLLFGFTLGYWAGFRRVIEPKQLLK